MKIFKFFLILSVFALFIFACNQTNSVNSTAPGNSNIAIVTTSNIEKMPGGADELASARKIYSEICVKCHKEDGKGGVRQIEDRKIKAPDFTSERMRKDDDNDWIDTIKHGAKEDGMPAFEGRLSDEEIKDLVKFIRREFQQK